MTSPSSSTPDTTAALGEVTFADLGLCQELLTELASLGYEEPTPIQREAVGPLLTGVDLLGQAATGTGKTAAFALPILNKKPRSTRPGQPVALILVPTRELCMQVSQAFHRYGRGLGTRVLPIYGGAPIGRQLRELERGVDVVVGTPGRVIDVMGRGNLDLSQVATVVLDEADEMLDMGFAEDIEQILQGTPDSRQTVLFSATMPPRINGIANRHLTKPITIRIEREIPTDGAAPKVRQTAYLVARPHKAAALGRILDLEAPGSTLVFCRTREIVDELAETLNGRGYRAEALHGGMSQEQRDRVMGRLRNQTADLLVATDVAARGLDVDHLTHVVNYDIPSAAETYVHRIGRVGRGGREGVALTLVDPRSHRMLTTIERATKQKITIERVPSTADLRARRLEMTRASLYESALADDLERFRVVVESLTDDFDLMVVALAAVKMAHEATFTGPDDEMDIPEVRVGAGDSRRDRKGGGDREERPGRRNRSQSVSEGMARVFIGAGRMAGIRPQDLVGAIAGETHLTGRNIGAIDIADRFSLVEVPSESVGEVVRNLSQTRIKGQRVQVRPDRDAGGEERRERSSGYKGASRAPRAGSGEFRNKRPRDEGPRGKKSKRDDFAPKKARGAHRDSAY